MNQSEDPKSWLTQPVNLTLPRWMLVAGAVVLLILVIY